MKILQKNAIFTNIDNQEKIFFIDNPTLLNGDGWGNDFHYPFTLRADGCRDGGMNGNGYGYGEATSSVTGDRMEFLCHFMTFDLLCNLKRQ